jgi:hypothetical protein
MLCNVEIEIRFIESELLGFWTSSSVRNSKYKKKNTQRFGNWVSFRPQMRGWGWGGDIYSVGSLRKS